MTTATAPKTSLFKTLRLTGRDLRVFGGAALLFTSLAIGAVSVIQPAHSQSAAAICSADKYFR